MRKTNKEYKKRIAEELELYSEILNKTIALFRLINSYETDLKTISEIETILNQYPEIIKINVKELTFNIRIQLEKSLDFLDKISNVEN